MSTIDERAVGERMMPVYRTLEGQADLPLMPPFRSLGLVMAYYPLLADLACMRRLCDEYLNFASKSGEPTLPEAVGRFEPLMPYVFVVAAQHPHLAVGEGSYGWFSQHEISFAFPVAWYRKRSRGWVFEGTAFFNPYIYIDSSLGMGTGRELDGWPKQFARFDGWGRELVAGGPPLRTTTLVSDGVSPLRPRVLFENRARRADAPGFRRASGRPGRSAARDPRALGVGPPHASQCRRPAPRGGGQPGVVVEAVAATALRLARLGRHHAQAVP